MKINIVLACGCCLFAGLWIGTLTEKSARAQSSSAKIISAQSIKLTDANGNVRIIMSAGPKNGQAGIIMLDPGGNARVQFVQNGEQDPALSLMDSKENIFFAATTLAHPAVILSDPKTKSGVMLTATHQQGYIDLYDANGKVLQHLQ